MKNRVLLTTAGMVAMAITGANAGVVDLLSQSGKTALTIHPSVDLVGTFEISTNSELKFGVVLGPGVNQTVTVTPDGAVYGDAKLLDQQLGAAANTKENITSKTVSAGSIKVQGAVDTLLQNAGAGSVYLDFPDSIDLKSGDTTCGTISNIPDINVPQAGDYAYGGTLTIKTAETGLHCTAEATVTLIMNETTPANP